MSSKTIRRVLDLLDDVANRLEAIRPHACAGSYDCPHCESKRNVEDVRTAQELAATVVAK